MSGIEVASKLIKEGSKTEFVLLTMVKEESFFRNALERGIKGYLLKESREDEILKCIRSVYRCMPYVNASLTQFLIKSGSYKDNLLMDLTHQRSTS
jgi:DNA-binding NarL/FixJ family response regulator